MSEMRTRGKSKKESKIEEAQIVEENKEEK